MKLLFFSNLSVTLDDEGIAGTGNWISSLIKAMISYVSDYEIYVAYHDKDTTCIEFTTINENVTTIKIPADNSKFKLGKLIDNWLVKDPFKKCLGDYLSIVNKVNPDIVQIFGIESPFIRLFGKIKIPIVIHLQGFLGPCLYKFYPYFAMRELLIAAKFSSILKADTAIQKKIRWNRTMKFERDIYPLFQYFLGRTDWDKLVAKAIAPNARYYYCQEILRSDFYKHQWVPFTDVNFNLFTIIRDEPVKNVNIIFETIKILETYHSTFKFNWRIAGVSKNDISVRIMIQRGHKSKHLTLLGKLPSSNLIIEMNHANAFVYPSGMDNSPNALQEAMLVGMPIIATHAGGISSLIENRRTGILVPEGDPYSLAGGILELKDSYEEAILMGKSARELTLIRNAPETVIESLISAYKNILFNIKTT